MTSAPSNKSQSQSKKFAEVARALGCDEDEAKFNAALGKVARHKSPGATGMKFSDILSQHGVPEGPWLSTEAKMVDDVWRVAILVKGHSAVYLDIGGAVSLTRDLEYIGENDLAEKVAQALKICRAR